MEDFWSQPPPLTCAPVTPRQPLPIFPPPESLSLPPLPSPARNPIFDAPYTLSTHIFPAAYLRSTQYVQAPSPSPASATKAERQTYANAVQRKLKDLRESLSPALGTKQVLWNCANRYVRVGLDERRASGVTLFFAHANGFPKEIWEPVLQHLLSSSAASVIDEVWTWESVQHGDACLINGERNGGVFDWTDNARDILNFFNFYLPSKASALPLPTHLVRVPAEESTHRQKNPFNHRTLVLVGHSYGGCTSTLAALIQPRLFSSLILIDPVIIKPTGSLIYDSKPKSDLVRGAVTRRETWSSRAEAFRVLSQSPFFGAWDPAVLKVYIECGTYDTIDPVTGKPMIQLKMPGMQEAVVFSETRTQTEVFQRLPTLDERIELRWIVPGKPGATEFGPPGSTRERVWARPQNASNIRIPNAGHLIAQEAPQALAHDIQSFLQRRYTLPRASL
ncbi:hypothetical protein H2248_003572 [Termitomyces sp. 'cryptogamus']|nr:hypothetical protein H2248_003572 [Termitomyces sp. 'cryptogamus']